jgi:outer membrane protein TolC
MYKFKTYQYGVAVGLCLAVASCKAPQATAETPSKPVPEAFATSKDTTNMASIPWHDFFKDQNLVNLIDLALKNNQELMMTLQEIEIAKNDVRVRKGLLLPTVGVRAGAGVEKVGQVRVRVMLRQKL